MSRNIIYLTAKETSDYLRIPLTTLYDLTKSGRIKAIKIGKIWRYNRSDIEKYFLYGTDNFSRIPPSEYNAGIVERRVYPRINCSILSILKVNIPEKREIISNGRVTNISIGGAFVENSSIKEMKRDDPISLEFVLDNCSGIKVDGRILRLQDNGIAVKFRKLSGGIKSQIAEYVG